MQDKYKYIAFFDSGVGGISVLREAIRVMPYENYIYFGDSKNAPYGTKNTSEVKALVLKNIDMLINMDVKAVVIACNTATSIAVAALREKYNNIPIIGIEPALKPAALSDNNSNVLVMATPITIKEKKLNKLLDEVNEKAKVSLLPCPGLMDFVEKGDIDSKELKNHIKFLLEPVKNTKFDAIVLGCTHYPFVKDVIVESIGYDVEIFDGAEGVVKKLKHDLEELNLENDKDNKGSIKVINSLEDKEKIELSNYLINLATIK